MCPDKKYYAFSMNVKLIRKERLQTNRWAGGTTTELAIYPQGADYGKRDFIWRVSSATVDDEESEFTRLDGVERILMILDGEIWLRHDDSDETHLARYDQTRFRGERKTTSRGRATDFNLMMKGAAHGFAEVCRAGGEPLLITDSIDLKERGLRFDLFYAVTDIIIEVNGQNYRLFDGDVIIIEQEKSNDETAKIVLKTESGNTSIAIHAAILC